MEAEIVRGRGAGGDYGRRYVPVVAGEAPNRGVVFEHGHAGPNRIILRYGDFPTHSVLRHGIHC